MLVFLSKLINSMYCMSHKYLFNFKREIKKIKRKVLVGRPYIY